MGGAGAAKTFLTVSLSSSLSRLSASKRFPLLKLRKPSRVFVGFRPLCTTTTTTSTLDTEADHPLQPLKHSILLERLRLRHLKDSSAKPSLETKTTQRQSVGSVQKESENGLFKNKKKKLAERFEELGLSEELMGAVREMNIEVPTEIQSIGIPAVLEGKSVVLGSHTGSGKTLAYLLPLVQVLLFIFLSFS